MILLTKSCLKMYAARKSLLVRLNDLLNFKRSFFMSAPAATAAPASIVNYIVGGVGTRQVTISSGHQEYNPPQTVVFEGHTYTKADQQVVIDASATGCCSCFTSCLRVMSLVTIFLASAALLAAGVGLGLAAVKISVWGSATYAAPAIKFLGTPWSHVVAVASAILGFTGLVGSGVKAFN